jgi:hypothetical protein
LKNSLPKASRLLWLGMACLRGIEYGGKLLKQGVCGYLMLLTS